MTTAATLTKAMLRAAEQLELTAELPAILRIPPSDLASLQFGERTLDPQRDEWRQALAIVSMFRTLITIVGTVERAREWLRSPNQKLGACPADLLCTVQGERVHHYLDAVLKHEFRMPPQWKPDRS
jgi:hypothetical protein